MSIFGFVILTAKKYEELTAKAGQAEVATASLAFLSRLLEKHGMSLEAIESLRAENERLKERERLRTAPPHDVDRFYLNQMEQMRQSPAPWPYGGLIAALAARRVTGRPS